MPGLSAIKILGDAKFASHGLKLPTSASWQQPKGDPNEQQYIDGIGQANRGGVLQLIPPWFTPQNWHKYHVDSCNTVGKQFKQLHDKMIDAIVYAHNMWRLQAKFKDLKIMAVSAIGTPGCLDGPALESFIKTAPSCAAMSGNWAKFRDAIAKGVSKAFENWQKQVTVPGLPWYPAFAAFPGPQAPPMPNVPMPLITCVSAKMTDIVMPNTMKSEMINALPSGLKSPDKDKQHEALFDSIATVCAAGFTIWLPSQMVMNVLGKGPIPTFAPPFVPVGPVIAGDNLPIPGHLAL